MADSSLSGCEVWTGAVNPDGYGCTTFKGKGIGAHRKAWIVAHGEIPQGMCVMHRCDNPPCVNLDHLRLGTHAENMADMKAKGRAAKSGWTHCKNGHEFDETNTYRPPGSDRRQCRQCKLDRKQAKSPNVGRDWSKCKYGHQLTTENTYTYTNGRTECRECRRAGGRYSRTIRTPLSWRH